MIYLAASRYNPEQEEGFTMGGGPPREDGRRGSSLAGLRKISLTTVGRDLGGVIWGA